MEQRHSAGLVILYDNKILLGHTTGRSWYSSYGIPKGGIDDGETPIDAAIRETFEEVGLKINKNQIDPVEYTFSLGYTKNKKQIKKIVHYFIVKIDSLSDIGLSTLKIPKSQLQIEEIDWAGFLDLTEASKRIMKSQKSLLDHLISTGLLESEVLTYEKFIRRPKL
jgi:8-oxo-dGTP pyrophosphatase MutT (NUDIX family)